MAIQDPALDGERPAHPWSEIDLGVYESHMADAGVGQLQMLHSITAAQLSGFSARAVGVLGVAGGNGLDLIDPVVTEVVYGYDVNRHYLAECDARYRPVLGSRLRLIETAIDRTTTIQPVTLLIANLIIEYVGLEEFTAFVALNRARIGVLSSVIQRNDTAAFVSATTHASSFNGLAAIASDIDADALEEALGQAGMFEVGRIPHSLPNGKALIRQDFRPTDATRGE